MAKLYFVATPIGNSQDLTFRAKSTLEQVAYIACEDTRRIRKLLAIYAIKGKKLLVHHAHNERQSTPGIIKLVEQGFDVALVSDAGMPGIADPGFLLMRAALEKT
ncbi:SAM-dependent methyltransferase [Mycoplasma sp. ATU-Cv-508]|uniref:SAM-dependent methyltransferase n=1 Tax=Mycoplasma sp. ATU-Cv-508 TaxID=2048001 RepID=UPI000FDD22AE